MCYLENKPAPKELATAWQCKQWGVMPEDGGLASQPAGLIRRMSMAYNTYEIFKTRYDAPDVIKWIESNPEANEHYAYVKGLLKEDGN